RRLRVHPARRRSGVAERRRRRRDRAVRVGSPTLGVVRHDRVSMRLEGIHHITAITADAPRNVEFYAGTLGLRLVKKTVNQDDPTVYHLFYADETGSSGSDITFFEYPGARRGRPGAGMVYRVAWRVASQEALDFWERRLGDADVASERGESG